MPKHKAIILLASRSPRRKALLKKAKIPFRIVRSDFKERTFPGAPVKTVIMNAVGKVKFARVTLKKGIVLGADTIVYFKNRIIGKPKTKQEAIQMLARLSGSCHEVYTGLALYGLSRKRWKTAYVRSKITMRQFTKREAKHYLSKVNPLDKAGAYAIQERGDKLVLKIEGSYSNVVGLPVERLKQLMTYFR